MTHTPGPWTASWSKYHEGTFVVKAGMPSNRVLASFDGDGDGPDDQSIANARLIAAAPALLEACKTALSELRDYADTHPSFKEIYDAIAAAEGSDTSLEARMRKGADGFAAILRGDKP